MSTVSLFPAAIVLALSVELTTHVQKHISELILQTQCKKIIDVNSYVQYCLVDEKRLLVASAMHQDSQHFAATLTVNHQSLSQTKEKEDLLALEFSNHCNSRRPVRLYGQCAAIYSLQVQQAGIASHTS